MAAPKLARPLPNSLQVILLPNHDSILLVPSFGNFLAKSAIIVPAVVATSILPSSKLSVFVWNTVMALPKVPRPLPNSLQVIVLPNHDSIILVPSSGNSLAKSAIILPADVATSILLLSKLSVFTWNTVMALPKSARPSPN